MLPIAASGAGFPIVVSDAYQNELRIIEKPRRVVSLVPSITEMLLAFKLDQVIVGLTRQDLILNPSKGYPVKTNEKMLLSRLEDVLMTPYYVSFLEVSFLESALSISDDYQKGLVKELAFFDTMCRTVAARIAGRPDITLMDVPSGSDLPVVVAKAFGALITGITEKGGRVLQ